MHSRFVPYNCIVGEDSHIKLIFHAIGPPSLLILHFIHSFIHTYIHAFTHAFILLRIAAERDIFELSGDGKERQQLQSWSRISIDRPGQ
jgi:hypothetical protein